MARRFVLSRPSAAGLKIDFADELNAQQLAAVSAGEGPKLVIAGAGTGKTRTLTYRVAWLLSQGVPVDGILLVTFTNKAAREMVDRVRRLTGVETHRMWGGTFHSVGARILRRHGRVLGYDESFSILDDSDQRDLLRVCVTDLEIEITRKRFPSPRVLRSMISLTANTGVELADVLANRYPRFLEWEEQVIAVARRYAERKLAANVMDYDDLLGNWLRLLREVPEVRVRYGQRLQYLLVDEYQDTNLVQGAVVEELAAENGGNLMVVGDDCQSIYAFRGAHYDNILEFPARNPGTEVFRLETNYRSTPEILALTNASIRNNPHRHDKELVAHRPTGQTPALVPCNYPEQEAAFVAERILQLRDEGTSLSELAVLYRAHSHRLSVETTLIRYDIPYEVRGGLRFFEQAHIKDVTAYLRVAENPRDEVAFRRVLLHQVGIGNVTAGNLWRAIAEIEGEFGHRIQDPRVQSCARGRAQHGWRAFCATMNAVLAATDHPEAAIRAVLENGYDQLASARFDNYESRVEDIEQLAVFAATYESVQAFLEELVLLGELAGQDVHRGGEADDDARVVLTTVHQAKGLEWEIVFLIHAAEGSLPSPRAIDEDGGEEEERRIFYVAMTRAGRELYLSYPIVRPGGMGGGALLQQPSRFLQELPSELMEVWELFEERVDPVVSARPAPTPVESVWDPNVDPIWDDEDYPQ